MTKKQTKDVIVMCAIGACIAFVVGWLLTADGDFSLVKSDIENREVLAGSNSSNSSEVDGDVLPPKLDDASRFPSSNAPLFRGKDTDTGNEAESEKQNCSITLHFKSVDGAPISFLSVNWKNYERRQWQDKLMEGYKLPIDSNISTTNENGEITLELPIVRNENLLVIWLRPTSSWNILMNSSEMVSSFGLPCWTTSLQEGVQSATITIERKSSYTIELRFADGQPVTGSVTYYSVGKVNTVDSTAFKVKNALQFDLPVSETMASGIIEIITSREGYESISSREITLDWLNNSPEIVITVDTTNYPILVFDLIQFDSNSKNKLFVFLAGRKQLVLNVMWGKVFRYRLDITGAICFSRIEGNTSKAWQCEPFEAKEGKEYRLHPRLQSGTTLTFKVVDEQGQPISSAYATIHEHRCPNWRSKKRVQGRVDRQAGEAYSNAAGKIVLPGVLANSGLVFVESDGYERKHLQISINGEPELNLGEVVLRPATGVLAIEVANLEPDTEYVLTIYGHGGVLVRRIFFDYANPNFQILNLALRKVYVAVGVKTKSSIKNILIEKEPILLSPEQPVVTKFLDISDSAEVDVETR